MLPTAPVQAMEAFEAGKGMGFMKTDMQQQLQRAWAAEALQQPQLLTSYHGRAAFLYHLEAAPYDRYILAGGYPQVDLDKGRRGTASSGASYSCAGVVSDTMSTARWALPGPGQLAGGPLPGPGQLAGTEPHW